MSERILSIGMYRLLRKLGVPREEVLPEADFDRDYFFTAIEKDILLNWVEFRYEIEFSQNEENLFHNPTQLLYMIKQKICN